MRPKTKTDTGIYKPNCFWENAYWPSNARGNGRELSPLSSLPVKIRLAILGGCGQNPWPPAGLLRKHMQW